MTANSDNTREFSIQQLLTMSLRTAGLINEMQGPGAPMWDAKMADAMNFLEMEMDSITEVQTRHVDWYDLTTVADQGEYTVTGGVIDFTGMAMYQDATNSNAGETVLTPIMRDAYQRLSAKTSSGRPYLYYYHRVETPKLFLWPRPDTTDDTIRFQAQYLAGDNDDASKTVDMDRFWVKYLVYAVAHHLRVAASMDPGMCGYLEKKSQMYYQKALMKSRQSKGTQMVIRHGQGWARR